jgi:hypothetical protein
VLSMLFSIVSYCEVFIYIHLSVLFVMYGILY